MFVVPGWFITCIQFLFKVCLHWAISVYDLTVFYIRFFLSKFWLQYTSTNSNIKGIKNYVWISKGLAAVNRRVSLRKGLRKLYKIANVRIVTAFELADMYCIRKSLKILIFVSSPSWKKYPGIQSTTILFNVKSSLWSYC